MTFSPEEDAACRRLVDLALVEDLGDRGDLTSLAVIEADRQGRAVFRARSAGVLAGLPAAALVVRTVDDRLRFEEKKRDGDAVLPGEDLAWLSGPLRGLLTAERTALNFLQYLSGIATQTRHFVDAVRGTKALVLDTRKTLPGWRLLAKYAVRCGGGMNHRLGLCDGILVKDNHLAGMAEGDRSIPRAIERSRTFLAGIDPALPVEIEVDTLEQFDVALACAPDIVLLDNMTPEQIRAAVRRRDAANPRVRLEASGGITLGTVAAVAATGVDRISVGALTHSVPALDIGLDYEV